MGGGKKLNEEFDCFSIISPNITFPVIQSVVSKLIVGFRLPFEIGRLAISGHGKEPVGNSLSWWTSNKRDFRFHRGIRKVYPRDSRWRSLRAEGAKHCSVHSSSWPAYAQIWRGPMQHVACQTLGLTEVDRDVASKVKRFLKSQTGKVTSEGTTSKNKGQGRRH